MCMVAEPDAQGGAQDHSVTGMGAMCTTGNRGVDRGPRRVALPTSAHLAHFRHQSQGAISRSSRARLRLAPERMPTMLIHIQRPTRTALLLQLDGTLPNLALMRLAAHLDRKSVVEGKSVDLGG